jgi:hypothetical protein
MSDDQNKKLDILELFGLSPSDSQVAHSITTGICPFTSRECIKSLRGIDGPTGVCAVSQGVTTTPVIVCPHRLYGDNYATLRMAAAEVYGADPLLIGGDEDELADKFQDHKGPAVVAFGQHSGHEIQIRGRDRMSFDWILQHHTARRRRTGFIAVEVQSMDTTGNYRDCLEGYRAFHEGAQAPVPLSRHGINWANVHKRLLPQLIRKGLILEQTKGCQGLFFVVPDNVYQRFEDVLEDLQEQNNVGPDILSIRTYEPAQTTSGVRSVRAMNFKIKDVAQAHYGRPDKTAAKNLEATLKALLS